MTGFKLALRQLVMRLELAFWGVWERSSTSILDSESLVWLVAWIVLTALWMMVAVWYLGR